MKGALPIDRPRRAMCCGTASAIPQESELDATAAVLKAISHPVRLAILHILKSNEDAVCACDIESHFDLSQPTISHHLRLLRQAGLVKSEARNPWVYFSLDRSGLTRLLEKLSPLV